MSRLGSLQDRRKRSFNFFSGRVLAVVVVLAVAALSFTLGYYAGNSGVEVVKDDLNVPDGAGVVLFANDNACPDPAGEENAKPTGPATGAVLETMSPLVPQPDGGEPAATPDVPLIAKPRKAGVSPVAATPEKVEPKTAGTPAPAEKPEIIRPEPKKPPVAEKPAPKATTTIAKPRVSPKPAAKPAKPKKPAARVTVKPAAQSSTYSVQVGAFKSLSDAQVHKRRFTQKGYKASVYPDRGSAGETIYKVRVGTFFDRQSADAMARKLKDAEGASSFVTTIR